MLTRLIVYFAYSLKASARYGQTRQFFYNLLETRTAGLRPILTPSCRHGRAESVLLLLYEAERTPDGVSYLNKRLLRSREQKLRRTEPA
jgi:hypothetical protein